MVTADGRRYAVQDPCGLAEGGVSVGPGHPAGGTGDGAYSQLTTTLVRGALCLWSARTGFIRAGARIL